MSAFKITNMRVIHGLFIEYTENEQSSYQVFKDISDNTENIKKLMALLGKYNDVDFGTLNNIIEDFVCGQSIP